MSCIWLYLIEGNRLPFFQRETKDGSTFKALARSLLETSNKTKSSLRRISKVVIVILLSLFSLNDRFLSMTNNFNLMQTIYFYCKMNSEGRGESTFKKLVAMNSSHKREPFGSFLLV